LVAVLSVSTVATGLTQIAVPLELRQLHASPTEIGVALSMFGFGMFLFEWVWGALADRVGYRIPLVASQLLYAVTLVFLARAGSVTLIAIAYLVASGMMVAVGPLGRSFLGTTLPPKLRATGLALIAAQWVIGGALGSGAGGQLIEHFPIQNVLYGAAVMPLIAAALLLLVFRGYRETRGIWSDDEAPPAETPSGVSFIRVMIITAAIVLLAEIGAGGETALLPLLVTNHLNLSAATAGSALLITGLFTGVLLVPGGMASDRWGRKWTMIAGGILSAAGFAAYAVAGSFSVVIVGAALRAFGSALIWPAATAWISESAPHRRHALVMGLFGEFENLGVTLGPVAGGLAWAAFGIQAAFVTYGVTALLVAVVAGVTVGGRAARASIPSLSRERVG
jgi:MFS transporter, DHA1 family, multidrug resistance protein